MDFAYVSANDKFWIVRIPYIPTVIVTPNEHFPTNTYTTEKEFTIQITSLAGTIEK